ncbi:RrF2 family transcriptional regulator [Levilactobacillus fujinensis]|uniref:RrF2 family transcriptional regulator n=1 Tax=Levilactobacillus fujinensis TaxID=2486024 RepID=A0ABW1TGC1_9LACO|nr:Rrf2 family transcriptional regulator [Levilactobacillus fujinensis]
MKTKPSLEQALCIVALLGIQDRNVPLHSRLVAEHLGISTSYLKKIVQKLAGAKIVKTISGRDGGIVLTKDPNQITLLDVFDAIEGTVPFVKNTGIVKKIFGFDQKLKFMKMYDLPDLHDQQPIANALAVFGDAEQRYRQELATLSIGQISPLSAGQPLQLDWTAWIKQHAAE